MLPSAAGRANNQDLCKWNSKHFIIAWDLYFSDFSIPADRWAGINLLPVHVMSLKGETGTQVNSSKHSMTKQIEYTTADFALVGKERKRWTHVILSPLSKYHTGLILTCETHYPPRQSKMVNWFSARLFETGVTVAEDKQSLSSSVPTDSLNQSQSKRIRLLMEKIWSAQSHLSSELLFTCGISGFVRAELLHSSKRGVIVLFSCEHTNTYIQQGSSSNNTASHHSLSATWVSTDGTMQTSGDQMPSSCELWLSSQPVRALFLFLLLLPSLEPSSS